MSPEPAAISLADRRLFLPTKKSDLKQYKDGGEDLVWH